MSNRFKLLVILFTLLFVAAVRCVSEFCEIEYPQFKSKDDAPFIYISERVGRCTYGIKAYIHAGGKEIISGGELQYRANAFYLTIDSLSTSKVKLFDFSQDVGDEYFVLFDRLSKTSGQMQMSVENIATSKKGSKIYIFRLKGAFIYDGDSNDMVFFVSRENGIVGSYISSYFEGLELVVAQRGDILLDELDYTSKEFRILE